MNDIKTLDTLFIVNPSSGKFNALNIFNGIKPSLNKNFILLVTTSKRDTKNLINSIDCSKINKIIGVGGDGTIKEIMEAIINKGNPSKKISFGHIPAGTGNGLAASIMYNNKLEYNLKNSIIPFNNNNIKNIDISTVESNNCIHHSFLALSIGFISDIDINTEFMRFIGSFRYYLGSIYGLYKMQTYNLKLFYNDTNNYLENITLKDKIPNEWKSITGDFIMMWAVNVTHPSYDVFINSNIKFNDGFHHIILIRNNITRWELLWILLELDKGNIIEHPKVIYLKTKQYRIIVNKDDNGIITVDGEDIGYNNVHVNVKNEYMNIVA